MNNLSNAPLNHQNFPNCFNQNPRISFYILVSLFFLGFGVSIFILVVVHTPILLISVILLFIFVFGFLLWNGVKQRRNGAFLVFLSSFPDSDLRIASHGQIVKIIGPVSCGNVSLESSYEKVASCIYTSTLLYECKGLRLTPCFRWKLAYSERYSTDFYIYDRKSGIRALVKAGGGSKVIPLIIESRLVNTRRTTTLLSPTLRQWLSDRNLSTQARLLCLEEGYVREGSCIAVIGVLRTDNDIPTLVEPPESISTGWQWRQLLLPVDFDGLILGHPEATDSPAN